MPEMKCIGMIGMLAFQVKLKKFRRMIRMLAAISNVLSLSLIWVCSLGLDHRTLSEVPGRKLSRFSVKKSSVLSNTKSIWTVRLHPNDVCASMNPGKRYAI